MGSIINLVFSGCVYIMYQMAAITGLSYEAINILLFVIIHPLITVILFLGLVHYRAKYRALKETVEVEEKPGQQS